MKNILEGYDGLAILSGVDMDKGVVRLKYGADLRSEVFLLLQSIADKISNIQL